jgi:hypothetical protein
MVANMEANQEKMQAAAEHYKWAQSVNTVEFLTTPQGQTSNVLC